MGNNGIRYVGTLKRIRDAFGCLTGGIFRKQQPDSSPEPQIDGAHPSEEGESVRHEETMKLIRGTIEHLTASRAQWDHQENGWELRLSANITHPDWPSRKWMIVAERRQEGKSTVSLHVDFGGNERGSGYTMSEYLFFQVTADEFVASINEPGFAESLYDDLAELERKVRSHEFPR